MDSFQKFQKQAKEKQDRQRLQERQKLEREKLMRFDQPDKRTEEDGIDRARRPPKQEGVPAPVLPKYVIPYFSLPLKLLALHNFDGELSFVLDYVELSR